MTWSRPCPRAFPALELRARRAGRDKPPARRLGRGCAAKPPWRRLACTSGCGQPARTSSLRPSRPPSSRSQPARPPRRPAKSPSYRRLSGGYYVLPRGSREKALAREAPVPVGKACKDGWVHSKCEQFSDRGKAHLQTLRQPDCIFTSPALPTVRVLGSLWCATHRNSSCFV